MLVAVYLRLAEKKPLKVVQCYLRSNIFHAQANHSYFTYTLLGLFFYSQGDGCYVFQ